MVRVETWKKLLIFAACIGLICNVSSVILIFVDVDNMKNVDKCIYFQNQFPKKCYGHTSTEFISSEYCQSVFEDVVNTCNDIETLGFGICESKFKSVNESCYRQSLAVVDASIVSFCNEEFHLLNYTCRPETLQSTENVDELSLSMILTILSFALGYAGTFFTAFYPVIGAYVDCLKIPGETEKKRKLIDKRIIALEDDLNNSEAQLKKKHEAWQDGANEVAVAEAETEEERESVKKEVEKFKIRRDTESKRVEAENAREIYNKKQKEMYEAKEEERTIKVMEELEKKYCCSGEFCTCYCWMVVFIMIGAGLSLVASAISNNDFSKLNQSSNCTTFVSNISDNCWNSTTLSLSPSDTFCLNMTNFVEKNCEDNWPNDENGSVCLSLRPLIPTYCLQSNMSRGSESETEFCSSVFESAKIICDSEKVIEQYDRKITDTKAKTTVSAVLQTIGSAAAMFGESMIFILNLGNQNNSMLKILTQRITIFKD